MKALLIAALLATLSFSAHARNYVSVVGSSTVYPFATVVAETFGKNTEFKTPAIESTGSGGGLKLFCAGVGTTHPDITNASRAIKSTEIEMCAGNGVTEVIEVKVGYDGIVVANAKTGANFDAMTRRDLYLALAKEVPAADENSLIPNPYTTWNEVNSALPTIKIEVLGPPPTSGTRDAFVELAMEGGAKTFDWLAALRKSDKKEFKRVSHTIREDGAYVEAGENDNLIVQKLRANPNTLGIFGFSFLDQNYDVVKGASVDGIAPEFELIANGEYPISRPLFMYAKKAHVDAIPGMAEFLAEFASERAWGPDGYLADKGLIPMPDEEREEMRNRAVNLVPMQ